MMKLSRLRHSDELASFMHATQNELDGRMAWSRGDCLSRLGIFLELSHSPANSPQKLHPSVGLTQPAERFRRRCPQACPIIRVRGREETANSQRGIDLLGCVNPVSVPS